MVVQDAQEATPDRESRLGVVIDEAELPELVHEVIDARPRRADHLRQVFLVDPGNDGLGLALPAEARQQQKNPGQPLFAGVEELVDEIGFVTDDARQQMRDEHFRETRLAVEHARHLRLVHSRQPAIAHGKGRGHAQRLTGQTSFAEELAGAQSRDDGFLAFLGRDAELHFASHEKVHRIRRRSLHENRVLVTEFQDGLHPGRASQQRCPVAGQTGLRRRYSSRTFRSSPKSTLFRFDMSPTRR